MMLALFLLRRVRNDPGTEFMARVMKHLCKCLNVTIAYEAAGHPRLQGTMANLVGRLDEARDQLCNAWARRWDEYVQAAPSFHRTAPDVNL